MTPYNPELTNLKLARMRENVKTATHHRENPVGVPMEPKAMAAAVQTPSDPRHHFALGQLLGTIATGILIWQTQGEGVVLNPQVLSQLIGGILGSFMQPQAQAQSEPTPDPNPPAPAA
jgi:hypothetical protein